MNHLTHCILCNMCLSSACLWHNKKYYFACTLHTAYLSDRTLYCLGPWINKDRLYAVGNVSANLYANIGLLGECMKHCWMWCSIAQWVEHLTVNSLRFKISVFATYLGSFVHSKFMYAYSLGYIWWAFDRNCNTAELFPDKYWFRNPNDICYIYQHNATCSCKII